MPRTGVILSGGFLTMSPKRRLGLGLFLLAGPCIVGCQAGGGGGPPHGIVAIGTTKADLFGLPAEYRALHPALESHLGRPVRFNSQPNGRAIAKQLEQGNIAYAILSAAEYATVPEPAKLTLLATAVNSLGKTSRQAHVIARATDGRFKTISDCAGKRFAFGAYGDPLTDTAAKKALEANGVPLTKILPELLLPPPMAMEARLYAQNIIGQNAATAIAVDLTVNAGVIDELTWSKLPETGGNPLTGPSRDQFKIIGETAAIPEMVFVAGPSADPAVTAKLKDYLLHKAKDDEMVRKQLDVTGFEEADRAAYDVAAQVLRK
jgi:ABC-type phosphate/phosphonate transport system substrate-binding protein